MMKTEIDNLRFPVGKFSVPNEIAVADIQEWISVIEAFPPKVEAAVENLSNAQLDTPYRDGGWTIRQVVHHLPDSHMNAYIRFKLALTEDNPAIKPYLEDKWAELPDGKFAPVDVSLELLSAVHKRWSRVLRNMSSADFKKTFFHPESKVTRTLEVNLALYEWHCRHHLAHITELKRRMGWK